MCELCACMRTISTVPTLLFLKFCELWQEVVQKKKKKRQTHASSFVPIITYSYLPPSPLSFYFARSSQWSGKCIYTHSLFTQPAFKSFAAWVPHRPSCWAFTYLKHISNILSGAMETLKSYLNWKWHKIDKKNPILLLWSVSHKCKSSDR